MNRPKPIVYAFGNPVSALFLYGFTTLVGYELYLQQATGPFFLLTIVMSSYASKCRQELLAYKAWQREWEAMEGDPRPSFFARRPRLKEAMFFAVFITSSYLTACCVDYDTAYTIGALMGVGIWVFTIKWVVQWWHGRKAKAKAVAGRKGVPVTVCLSVPHTSSTRRQTVMALPPYCKPLLLQSLNA